jgi:hypothetical protein
MASVTSDGAQEYIAEPIKVICMGLTFEAYKAEDGSPVYSRRKAAEALGLPVSTFNKYRNRIASGGDLSRISTITNARLQTVEALRRETLRHEHGASLKAQTSTGTTIIEVILKSEILAWILVLAEAGSPKFKAMMDAGLATVFQMAEDRAFGVERSQDEYLAQAAELQQLSQKYREELRMVSGRITNPLLGPNVYKPNNELVYGPGLTRNTYDGDDAALRHELVKSAEMMEAGAKLFGHSIPDSIERVHDFLRERFDDVLTDDQEQ